MNARPITQQRHAYLIATWRTHTVHEQAAALGISYTCAIRLRGQILRAGQVRPTDRRGARQWSAIEIEHARSLIAQGVSIYRTARALRRSVGALRSALLRNDESLRTIRADPLSRVYTLQRAFELIGVSRTCMETWIARGWLTAKRNDRGGRPPRRPRSHYLITVAALDDFFRVADAWPSYDPNQIRDPDLRDAAWRCRGVELPPHRQGINDQPPQWLVAKEYARMHHWDTSSVCRLCRAGVLEGHKIAGRWYVRVQETRHAST